MSFRDWNGSLVHDYIGMALAENPDGSVCSFCNNVNDLADDCGWFYLRPTPESKGYACEACYNGTPGEQHRARYGVGDR